MTDILPVLICVQTVCKCYQQMKKIVASKEEVKRTYQYNSGALQEAVLVIQEAIFYDLYEFKSCI